MKWSTSTVVHVLLEELANKLLATLLHVLLYYVHVLPLHDYSEEHCETDKTLKVFPVKHVV